MGETFEVYRDAAREVRRGWARLAWRNDVGGVCLVQSVLDQLDEPLLHGMAAQPLPDGMVEEIDASLQRYRSYRLIRRIRDLIGDSDRQGCIVAWNDYMGTQRRVARALDELADQKELEFLRAEQVRLLIKIERLNATISNLTARKQLLEEQVKALQSQNKVLRLLNSPELRQELRSVDRELDACWASLTGMRDELTSERFAPLDAAQR